MLKASFLPSYPTAERRVHVLPASRSTPRPLSRITMETSASINYLLRLSGLISHVRGRARCWTDLRSHPHSEIRNIRGIRSHAQSLLSAVEAKFPPGELPDERDPSIEPRPPRRCSAPLIIVLVGMGVGILECTSWLRDQPTVIGHVVGGWRSRSSNVEGTSDKHQWKDKQQLDAVSEHQ